MLGASAAHLLARGLGFGLVCVAAALLAGCGTEPSNEVHGSYQLVAADEATTGRVSCFASTWRYESGSPVYQGECDVSLRSFTARFDSTGPSPELVLAAGVTLEGGDTATWQARLPARIRNSTIEYDFGPVTEPFTTEQVFVLPLAGTVVDGVLTLLMPSLSSSGLPDRTEYLRQAPSVFMLTATGGPLPGSALAGRYVGVAVAGTPMDHCTTEMPSRCLHRSLTLSSSGSMWRAWYEDVATLEGDTVGGRSLEATRLMLTRTNGFVHITDGQPPTALLRFEARGSLVGSTLTLFPSVRFLDGSGLSSPIVARAQ